MWIESIDLDDFGHFNRARLDGLDDGLTVVAGPQRAGKTTFMEAVRYVGHGLTTGANVPPATDRYAVTATVVKDGYRYEIELDGYASPTVTALDSGAPDQSARELFGNMRKTQYQQLYTVSLDELSREPGRLDDDVDLSTVLLEAASGGNISDVPDLRDDFAGAAKDIGGKHGRKSYDLNDPLDTIEAGIEMRDEATEQVAEHEATADEKQEVEARIDEIDTEIEATRAERTRLEAVATAHDAYQEYRSCSQELESTDVEDANRFPLEHLEHARDLQDDLETAQDAFEETNREFEASVTVSDPKQYCDDLLEARETIEEYEHEQSGWEERVSSLQRDAANFEETRNDLEQRARDLGPGWGDDPLDTVRTLDTDLFSRDAVSESVERYTDASEDVGELEQDVGELEGQKQGLEERIETATESASGQSLTQHLPTALAGTLIGVLAGGGLAVTVHPLVGVTATAIVLLAAGWYAASKTDTAVPSHDGVSIDSLRAELDKTESELDAKRDRLEQREQDLDDAAGVLEDVRDRYDLPSDLSPTGIERFLGDLHALQRDLEEYDADRRRHRTETRELTAELQDVLRALHELDVVDETPEQTVDDALKIFAGIERAVDHLEHAETVAQAEQELRGIEEAVVEVLATWEETDDASVGDDALSEDLDRFVQLGTRVEEYRAHEADQENARRQLVNEISVQAYADALEPVVDRDQYDGDRWLIVAFEDVLDEHGSVEALEARRDELGSTIDDLEEEKERCRDRLAELETELETLASDEDVREAHETIERGRRDLEPLAGAYATNRIAEYLLDELHDRFIERTTGPLLAEASDIFQRITGDTYTEINSRDEFDDLDFEAVLENGEVHTTSELSRATAEQLFLAVRLARIKRYEEPLPVLLDDSLTNFDPGHAQRTLDVVYELADDVQVFLLTCHPTLVDTVANAYDAQYWCLDDGAFDGPHRSTDQIRAVFEEGASGPRIEGGP